MLLMNKTLLKLARGLWLWILAIAGVGFLTLVGTTALAEIIAGFLGTLFQPQAILNTAWSAIRAALAAAVFTFLAQLLKGLLEYRTAAKAREGMRKMIFSKVLELDAGGIEKWVKRAEDIMEQDLAAAKEVLKYYFKIRNRSGFSEAVRRIKESSLVLDGELLEWVRFYPSDGWGAQSSDTMAQEAHHGTGIPGRTRKNRQGGR